jgi:hypothetical protein
MCHRARGSGCTSIRTATASMARTRTSPTPVFKPGLVFDGGSLPGRRWKVYFGQQLLIFYSESRMQLELTHLHPPMRLGKLQSSSNFCSYKQFLQPTSSKIHATSSGYFRRRFFSHSQAQAQMLDGILPVAPGSSISPTHFLEKSLLETVLQSDTQSQSSSNFCSYKQFLQPTSSKIPCRYQSCSLQGRS